MPYWGAKERLERVPTLDDVDLTDLGRLSAGFPHDVFTRLRREAPVFFHAPTRHTPGGEGFWVLSRHAEISTAALDADAFSSATGGGRAGGGTLIEDLPLGFAAGVLLNMQDGARHLRFRRLDAVELELQMFFNLLVAAGSETTRNSIALGLAALVEHPAAWDALRADRALLPGAVEEMLRWASSTPYNRRTATRDALLGGRTIRAGDKVTLWWASANRDEAVFPDPFRFDIRRRPNPHLAFGHGAHFCLGASLARLEVRLVFEALLDRFEEAVLDGPIEWTRSNKHTGVRHMPVVLRRSAAVRAAGVGGCA